MTGITRFGAFVQLPGGVTGLVHISEIADTFVRDVRDYLQEKDKVRVKVIHIDEKGKIGLSIKQADPSYDAHRRQRQRPTLSFEEKLAHFMKDSEERLSALRDQTETKRGGRGSARF